MKQVERILYNIRRDQKVIVKTTNRELKGYSRLTWTGSLVIAPKINSRNIMTHLIMDDILEIKDQKTDDVLFIKKGADNEQ